MYAYQVLHLFFGTTSSYFGMVIMMMIMIPFKWSTYQTTHTQKHQVKEYKRDPYYWRKGSGGFSSLFLLFPTLWFIFSIHHKSIKKLRVHISNYNFYNPKNKPAQKNIFLYIYRKTQQTLFHISSKNDLNIADDVPLFFSLPSLHSSLWTCES